MSAVSRLENTRLPAPMIAMRATSAPLSRDVERIAADGCTQPPSIRCRKYTSEFGANRIEKRIVDDVAVDRDGDLADQHLRDSRESAFELRDQVAEARGMNLELP